MIYTSLTGRTRHEENKRDDLGKEADFLLSLNRAASRTRRSS